MTTPVGGQRARFVLDSTRLAIVDILTQLHWLEHHDGRADLTILDLPPTWDQAVDKNTLGISLGPLPTEEQAETGSDQAIRTWTIFASFWAENQTIGNHLGHDLTDALAGHMPSIGWDTPFVSLYNLNMATPTEFSRAYVSSVVTQTPPNVTSQAWASHLHVVVIELEDTYGNDEDT